MTASRSQSRRTLLAKLFSVAIVLLLAAFPVAQLTAAQDATPAAAAGLIIGMTAKMAHPLLRVRPGPAPVFAVIVFAAVGLMRWPLPWVLIVLAPISIALAWWERR